MNRQELGDLWLRWYVHRSDPRQPFAAIWETADGAQQLRVRDVAEDERVWEALSQPDPNAPEMSHTKKIEEYENRYRSFEAVALIAPAWSVPEGLVLVEGAHRACALYRLNPPRLDADTILLSPETGCPDIQPGPRSSKLADNRTDVTDSERG